MSQRIARILELIYPHLVIGCRVKTPRGGGILRFVERGHAGVELDAGRLAVFDPDKVVLEGSRVPLEPPPSVKRTRRRDAQPGLFGGES
jgi:hypothetical protein